MRAADSGVVVAERLVLAVVVSAAVDVAAAAVEVVDARVASRVQPELVEPSSRVGISGLLRPASCGMQGRNFSSVTLLR